MLSENSIIDCGAINSVAEVLKSYSAKKIFLVTGDSSYKKIASDFEPIISSFDTVRYFGFKPNPQLNDVIKGIYLFKQFQPDATVCIGGGSVLDMGKLINTLGVQFDSDYKNIIKNNEIKTKGPPLLAIPTTAGTGSESTHFSVVYVDNTKFSLAHPFMMPDKAIVDPELCFNMPKYLAASSGMDALCQSVESYWSNGATYESRGYALEAIKLIRDAIVNAISKNDKTSMIAMSKAANLAGKAINISKTTAPHAISYGITSCFSIPHGHAVSLTLGKFFEINSSKNNHLVDQKITLEDHQERMHNLFSLFGASTAKECHKKWLELMKNIGLESDFIKLGMSDSEKIKYIVDSVDLERLGNNPVHVSRKILQDLFRSF